jgi:DNA-binding protein HU-beta
MNKYSKTELIEMVASELGLPKAQVEKVYRSLFDHITKILVNGEAVSLPDFGIFTTKERKARDGRNPRSGAVIKIPATRVPGFRPGKKLKEAIAKAKNK